MSKFISSQISWYLHSCNPSPGIPNYWKIIYNKIIIHILLLLVLLFSQIMASILELSHSSILHGACTLDNTEYSCFTQFINIKQAERNTQQAQSNMIRICETT